MPFPWLVVVFRDFAGKLPGSPNDVDPHKSGGKSASALLDAHIPALRSPFPDYATNTAQVPFCSIEEA